MKNYAIDSVCICEPKSHNDFDFLWDILFEAAAVSSHMRSLGKERCLALPEIKRYLDDWGRTGDFALVAMDLEREVRIGAAWYRLFPANDAGYGYISKEIPELSIGVVRPAQRSGIGTQLLQNLIKQATGDRYPGLSLSVDRTSAAMHLYKRNGFVVVNEQCRNSTSVTMYRASRSQELR